MSMCSLSHRWVLYVAVAMLGLLLQVVSAQAAASTTKPETSGILEPQNICPACPVLKNYLRGALDLAEAFAQAVSSEVSRLVGVILTIWLMIQVGKLLLPFGPLERASKIFNGIFGRAGLAIMVLLSIQSSQVYMNYLLYPLIDSTVDFTGAVLRTANTHTLATSIVKPAPSKCVSAPLGNAKPKESIIHEIDRQVCQVQEAMGKSMCVAFKSYKFNDCFASEKKNKTFYEAMTDFFGVIGDGAKTMNTGLEGLYKAILWLATLIFFMVIYGWVWAIYPIYMMDAVVKWSIISVLFPLMAAAFIFPSLRPATFAAIKGLFHACLTIIFMAVIMGVLLAVNAEIMDSSRTDKLSSMDEYAAALGDFWVSVISGLLMVNMLKQAPRMAGYFIVSVMDSNVADGLFKAITGAFNLAADLAIDIASAGSSRVIREAAKTVQVVRKLLR